MTEYKKALSNYLVALDNDILAGAYDLGINELRLINLFLAHIDSRKPQSKEGYTVTTKQFIKAYGNENNSIYGQLRDSVKKIIRSPIKRIKGINKRGNSIVEEIAWAGSITYERGLGEFDSYVKIKFSQEIEPFLFSLKSRFTSISFKYLAKLNTPFSVRLYMWLKAYNYHGAKNKIELEIEWIKERTGLTGKYKQFNQYKLKVIDPAVERINNNTDLNITYTLNKEGKSYKSITFKLNSKSLLGKPKRERLPRRPKVKSGSDAEGKWAIECISILTKHQKEIAKNGDWLNTADIKRLINCYKIIGDIFQVDAWEKYLKRRSEAKNNNKSTNNDVDSLIKGKEEFHYNDDGIKVDNDGIPLFED